MISKDKPRRRADEQQIEWDSGFAVLTNASIVDTTKFMVAQGGNPYKISLLQLKEKLSGSITGGASWDGITSWISTTTPTTEKVSWASSFNAAGFLTLKIEDKPFLDTDTYPVYSLWLGNGTSDGAGRQSMDIGVSRDLDGTDAGKLTRSLHAVPLKDLSANGLKRAVLAFGDLDNTQFRLNDDASSANLGKVMVNLPAICNNFEQGATTNVLSGARGKYLHDLISQIRDAGSYRGPFDTFTDLPSSDISENSFYLVGTASPFSLYIWAIDQDTAVGSWEYVGTTEVSLADYTVKSLVAGTGIDITAGTGDNAGEFTITNTGGSGAGVSKIIAGTGVSISPTGGTGDVTITATGGGGGASLVDGYLTQVQTLDDGTVQVNALSSVATMPYGYGNDSVFGVTYDHEEVVLGVEEFTQTFTVGSGSSWSIPNRWWYNTWWSLGKMAKLYPCFPKELDGVPTGVSYELELYSVEATSGDSVSVFLVLIDNTKSKTNNKRVVIDIALGLGDLRVPLSHYDMPDSELGEKGGVWDGWPAEEESGGYGEPPQLWDMYSYRDGYSTTYTTTDGDISVEVRGGKDSWGDMNIIFSAVGTNKLKLHLNKETMELLYPTQADKDRTNTGGNPYDEEDWFMKFSENVRHRHYTSIETLVTDKANKAIGYVKEHPLFVPDAPFEIDLTGAKICREIYLNFFPDLSIFCPSWPDTTDGAQGGTGQTNFLNTNLFGVMAFLPEDYDRTEFRTTDDLRNKPLLRFGCRWAWTDHPVVVDTDIPFGDQTFLSGWVFGMYYGAAKESDFTTLSSWTELFVVRRGALKKLKHNEGTFNYSETIAVDPNLSHIGSITWSCEPLSSKEIKIKGSNGAVGIMPLFVLSHSFRNGDYSTWWNPLGVSEIGSILEIWEKQPRLDLQDAFDYIEAVEDELPDKANKVYHSTSLPLYGSSEYQHPYGTSWHYILDWSDRGGNKFGKYMYYQHVTNPNPRLYQFENHFYFRRTAYAGMPMSFQIAYVWDFTQFGEGHPEMANKEGIYFYTYTTSEFEPIFDIQRDGDGNYTGWTVNAKYDQLEGVSTIKTFGNITVKITRPAATDLSEDSIDKSKQIKIEIIDNRAGVDEPVPDTDIFQQGQFSSYCHPQDLTRGNATVPVIAARKRMWVAAWQPSFLNQAIDLEDVYREVEDASDKILQLENNHFAHVATLEEGVDYAPCTLNPDPWHLNDYNLTLTFKRSLTGSWSVVYSTLYDRLLEQINHTLVIGKIKSEDNLMLGVVIMFFRYDAALGGENVSFWVGVKSSDESTYVIDPQLVWEARKRVGSFDICDITWENISPETGAYWDLSSGVSNFVNFSGEAYSGVQVSIGKPPSMTLSSDMGGFTIADTASWNQLVYFLKGPSAQVIDNRAAYKSIISGGVTAENEYDLQDFMNTPKLIINNFKSSDFEIFTGKIQLKAGHGLEALEKRIKSLENKIKKLEGK